MVRVVEERENGVVFGALENVTQDLPEQRWLAHFPLDRCK
jgi:hypothetical protein